MHCEQVRQTLDSMVRQGNKPLPDEAVTVHLHSCDLCRKVLADMQLNHQLQQLQPPELDQSTRQRLLKRAVAPQRQSGIPAAAMAAMLMLGVFVTYLYTGNEQGGALTPEVALTQGWRSDIRLVVHSDVDVSDAEISITLAENLELEGFPGQQDLAWRTTLKKGANLLVLPLQGIDGSGGSFELTSSTGAKQSRIVVSVDEQGKARGDSTGPANKQGGSHPPHYPATSSLPNPEVSRGSGQESTA